MKLYKFGVILNALFITTLLTFILTLNIPQVLNYWLSLTSNNTTRAELKTTFNQYFILNPALIFDYIKYLFILVLTTSLIISNIALPALFLKEDRKRLTETKNKQMKNSKFSYVCVSLFGLLTLGGVFMLISLKYLRKSIITKIITKQKINARFSKLNQIKGLTTREKQVISDPKQFNKTRSKEEVEEFNSLIEELIGKKELKPFQKILQQDGDDYFKDGETGSYLLSEESIKSFLSQIDVKREPQSKGIRAINVSQEEPNFEPKENLPYGWTR